MIKDFSPDRYSTMQYRRCGTSGLKLPLISLGFWQTLGEPGNEELCREVMYYAFDQGITHFDFANNYGPPPGNAEAVAGKILKAMPRDELVISTKAGYKMWEGPYQTGGCRKYMISSLDASLKRLGLDYVDIFYHHTPDKETPMEESLGALDHVVRQGKAIYAGVSSYNGEQFQQACEIIRRNNWTRLIIHQPRMNMLVRQHEFGLLPHTEREGVGVIAFCPLEQGALTDRYRHGIPADSRRGKQGDAGREWYDAKAKEGYWTKVEKLAAIADARGQKLSQLALAWLLRDNRVTSVLVGVSKMDQLKENIGALKNIKFSEDELKRIEDILK
ncbi:L-glyceraldehyde 3-phosphate reductase [soil metagenome]